jgi:hypothetical protein
MLTLLSRYKSNSDYSSTVCCVPLLFFIADMTTELILVTGIENKKIMDNKYYSLGIVLSRLNIPSSSELGIQS